MKKTNGSFANRKKTKKRMKNLGQKLQAENALPKQYKGSWLALFLHVLQSGTLAEVEQHGGIRMGIASEVEGGQDLVYDLNIVFVKAKCFEELVGGMFNVEQLED